MFHRINGFFEEINRNKYLTIVSTNEGKDNIKKYEELWIKIRDLIRCYVTIELTFQKELISIKQVHPKSVIFVIIGIS